MEALVTFILGGLFVGFFFGIANRLAAAGGE